MKARGVVVGWLGAWSLAGVLAACSRPRAPEPTASVPSASATVSARVVARPEAAPSESALPLGVSVPPPPSKAQAFAASRQTSPQCEAMTAANQRAEAQLAKKLGPSPFCVIQTSSEPLGCATDSKGVTWAHRLVSATAGIPKGKYRDTTNCETSWRIEMVRQAQSGEVTVVRGSELGFETGYYLDVSLFLQALSDYDGDGESEVLRTVRSSAHEGDQNTTVQVMTYRGGRLEEYAPARGLHISEAIDIDGDGLVDLTTSVPYDGLSTESDIGATSWIAPSLFAYHAQRDGSFRLGTPAAIAYAQSQCPERQFPELIPDIYGGDYARSLICARLWGHPAASIEAPFKKVCPKTYEQSERERIARRQANLPDPEPAADENAFEIRACRDWVVQLARIQPPFTFTPAKP